MPPSFARGRAVRCKSSLLRRSGLSARIPHAGHCYCLFIANFFLLYFTICIVEYFDRPTPVQGRWGRLLIGSLDAVLLALSCDSYST